MNGPPHDGAPHPADAPTPSTSTAVAPLAPSAGVIQSSGETSSSAIAAQAKAAVEARFLMALHRPRNPDNARTRVLARCKSPAFAEVAEYSKTIGKQTVTGASIRMMEELARQWGNIDVNSSVIFDDAERRTIRVVATDLETNYSASVDVLVEKTVERKFPAKTDVVISSRLNSKNETVYLIEAGEDAFLVKQNANVAKARREMIRAIMPGDLVEEALDVCFETKKNRDAKDPSAARKQISDLFFRRGIMPGQIAEFLGKTSLEAITEAEFATLRQIYTSIKEGETTWEDEVAARRESGQLKTSPLPKGAGAGLRQMVRDDKERTKPCPTCARSDGTHDPEKACYTD